MFYILQSSNTDCGYTCIKMLLANLNKDENYLYLTNKEDNLSSLSSLIEEANKYGLLLSASRAINKEALDKYAPLPFIAVMNEFKSHHAVYVYKINKKYVYYFDPAIGFKKEKISFFTNSWDGTFLKVEEYHLVKCPIKKPRFVTLVERIFPFIMTTISGVSCILGVYFVNKEASYYIPIIFFMLMILSEVILKKFSLLTMKKIDKRISDNYEIVGSNYSSYHRYHEEYKKYAITNELTNFSSFIIVMMLSGILMLNDKMNAIYIGVNILLAALFYFLIRPVLKKKEMKMLTLENKLDSINDESLAKDIMNECHSLAYKYADYISIVKYLIILIQLGLAFLMMRLANVTSITYIICYLLLEVYLYQNIVALFKYSDDKNKENNILVKMLSVLIKK